MRAFPLLAVTATLASAITLDIDSVQSIQDAASTTAWGLVQYYTGNQTGQAPGTVTMPYYWWECGAMFGALIDYWYYTGDSTYNDLVSEGLLFQASDYLDFMPPNQTRDEGNDDQVFWGFAAMEAAEYGFPNPPADQPQWLELAQGVFNSQAERWDNATCNGGLRWQIFTWNDGYTYKNAPSNAGFANLASRLYLYTGNGTYADWVEASWGWMEGVGMIDASTGAVYDGVSVGDNCSTVNHVQWTYSAGMVINLAANMWNVTQDDLWQQRMMMVWNATETAFFSDGKVMNEISCQPGNDCDTDMLSFKAYLARFLSASCKVAPFFWDMVSPYLQASAQAAAQQCDGSGANGNTQACGATWIDDAKWDGSTGLGQEMAALEVIQSLLTPEAAYPLSATHGGTSKGNPNAGSNGDMNSNNAVPLAPITTTDRAGAWIATGGLAVFMAGGGWWLCS